MLKNLALRHPYLILFALAWLFRLTTALFFQQPGYSDAYYYADIAQSLWHGRGFQEDFIWNYLGRPLPVTPFANPSSTYWLPLTSVVIYLGYLVSGGTGFFAAQIPMTLLSAALAPLCYYIAVDIFGPNLGARYGWFSGFLAIFCGIYAPYFVQTDNFAPFALLTALFLVCNYKALRLKPDVSHNRSHILKLMALAGILAGLSYLTRVDGVFLLVVAVLSLPVYRYLLHGETALNWRGLGVMLLAFAVTVTPWLWHNLGVSQQLFPGGGLKTLFLREYDDFFSYVKPLDLSYYLNQTMPVPDWGIGPLLLSKLSALWQNLLIVGRGTLFIMLPLFGLGLFCRLNVGTSPKTNLKNNLPDLSLSWGKGGTLWRRPEFLPFVLYLVLLYLAMSLLFTFPSTRGSVFHSSGGLLPFIYLAIAVGLDMAIVGLGKISRPKAAASRLRVYRAVLVLASIFLAFYYILNPPPEWKNDYPQLRQVAAWLDANGQADAVLMVPDAPTYYYATGKPSIVISSDPLPIDLQLAKQYGATYLLLQPSHAPAALTPLYRQHAYPGFTLAARFGEVELYKINF